MASYTLSGSVLDAATHQPVANATVSLITSAQALRGMAGMTLLPPNSISWSRVLTGFAGSRWDCWERYVRGRVPGLSWAQFRDEVLLYNPQLSADERLFRPERSYLLPEQTPGVSVLWTRPLMGFSGYRWECWEQYVQGRLPMSWEEFRDKVLEVNPQLEEDGRVFLANKVYLLPDITGAARGMLRSSTGPDGRWRIEGIPGLQGVVEVSARGRRRYAQPVVINQDRELLVLLPGGSSVHSDLPDYASLPPVVRALVDQALTMLGDDQAVFDALPARLQQLCYGARYNDPNDLHYKDIVCADLVSIALVAAGLDINWAEGNTHRADHYRPGSSPRLIEVRDPNDWLPGDILCYWRGDLATRGLEHVNLYVGPFSGTDLSGTVHRASEGKDVVEASMAFTRPDQTVWGRGVIGVSRAACLQNRRGYTNLTRVRLVDLARAFGR